MEKEKKESWEEIGKKLYEEWANREPFHFSPWKDPMYTQQRDAIEENAKRAANDAAARATAATGGYGNSYATTASEAAYRKGSEGVADLIPSLYDLAYSRYRDEGDALYDQMRVVNQFADDDRAESEKAQKEEEAKAKEEDKQQAYNDKIIKSSYWPQGLDPDDVLIPTGRWIGVSIDEAYAVLLKAGAKNDVLKKIVSPGEWTKKKSFAHPDVAANPDIYDFQTYEKYLMAYVNDALASLR